MSEIDHEAAMDAAKYYSQFLPDTATIYNLSRAYIDMERQRDVFKAALGEAMGALGQSHDRGADEFLNTLSVHPDVPRLVTAMGACGKA